MWPFRKKQMLAESGFFCGFIDWHSHILPDVDDGVQTMEEALQVLTEYEKLGVKEVWLTPHIMEDIPNTTGKLRERFAELRSAYQGPVVLNLASENMLDNLFEERLKRNDLLPIGRNGDHLLIETSYFNPPMGLQNILMRIKTKGYYPVLAHPERYVYMEETEYRQLKTMGVKFQLNLPSLANMYTIDVRKKAGWLLKNDLYDFVGSDLHRLTIWKEKIFNKQISENTLRMLRGILTALFPE
ncbi:tyrosine-protein phosphatase [Phocaeicola massiliensis]|uniref:tyrosine-protein phosphatase n=1 Tax=Phocaeicola massiliensis TaxID=204516 RepID=UPI00202ED25C|nr:CpsB/CapC family capsule biosynthesis tyrosine phosphatase [Phocaeicola massiliensis]MCM1613857.1 capsular biosynthesis protein [Phocaeicola massiliensis]MCM1705844.1 capsular biosynthesis protein [Phocaeicola massiliensis]